MSHGVKPCVFGCTLAFAVGMVSGCANPLSGSGAIQITPTASLLSPGQTLQFKVITDLPKAPPFLWQVNGITGGSPSVGTITEEGLYTAPSTPTVQQVQIGVRDQQASATVTLFDPFHASPGSVGATQNPLVATYTISIPLGASVRVLFGADTSYGLSTSAVPSPALGGAATVLVAGMRASTTYHMQGVIKLMDGSQVTDVDHTFTTGAIPTDSLPSIRTQVTGVGTPSSGIELLSLVPLGFGDSGSLLSAVATDLAGNVIWYYELPIGAYVEPIKPLPNGHMLMVTLGSVNDIREIDLAGNLINQITASSIAESLTHVASFQNAVWGGLNHDVLVLPNGHLILLASIGETINGEPGIPSGTVVNGNALIDWDLRLGAVWTWSTFDHLDLAHAPYGISDWTHGNAVIYSPDDGNLLFSMRNQNWIVKINYQDGTGDGSILWRFGPGGDFSLPGQEAPIEWNYGQHYPTIQSAASSGIFSLMFFDNGNDRLMDSSDDVCGSAGVGACYSSVPIFELNEYTKTGTVLWVDNLSPAYSTCCGDALVLPNGNVEFDVALDVNSPNSYIEEVTQTQTPELIWRMDIQGQLAYRGFRIPSLYPGQVWPAYAENNLRRADIRQRIQRRLNP